MGAQKLGSTRSKSSTTGKMTTWTWACRRNGALIAYWSLTAYPDSVTQHMIFTKPSSREERVVTTTGAQSMGMLKTTWSDLSACSHLSLSERTSLSYAMELIWTYLMA